MTFIKNFLDNTRIESWDMPTLDSGLVQRVKVYPRLHRHKLPPPALPRYAGLVDALLKRHSALDFSLEDLTPLEISNFLASVSYRNEPLGFAEGRRTYPSAGARYPVEVYMIALRCEEIPEGLYHYAVREHELEELWKSNFSERLLRATNDPRLARASAVIVLSIVFGRAGEKYGNRGLRYGLIEVGHVAQNIALTVCSSGKACYEIGGFLDSELNAWLDLEAESEAVALLLAIGGNCHDKAPVV